MAYWISAEWDAPRGAELRRPHCRLPARAPPASPGKPDGPRVEVAVHRLAAGLHLQFVPLPRAVRDEARAGQMCGRLIYLVRSW